MKGPADILVAAIALTLAAAVLAAPAAADGLRLRTELGGNGAWAAPTSLDTTLGYATRQTTTANMRLMYEKQVGDFRFQLHANINGAQGGDVGYLAAVSPFLPTQPPSTLFDMEQTWLSGGNRLLTGRVERLSVTYTTPNLVLKLGRQAITWGSGMVFHPTDIVAPFAPNAIDKSYKPGADMVYAQYLFDNGADLQAIAVPRGLSVGGPVAFSNSTYALRGKMSAGSLDLAAMFARDRGDSVAGAGLSGALGGASWNTEYVLWKLANGATYPSWVANISNFSTLTGRNISWFAEVYHNGFGVNSGVPYAGLPTDLVKRMSTGQVFVAGRDFLALGGRIELNPDMSASTTSLFSLNDGSAFSTLSVNYSLSDNANVVLSYSQPFGALGTEFGGRETATGSGVYMRLPKTLSLSFVRYF